MAQSKDIANLSVLQTALAQDWIPKLTQRVAQLSEALAQIDLLQDVSQGLYEELDKLCKKAPAETITDLALSQINTVIKETKGLVVTDAYVSRLTEFVAAGDNPEHRDVVVVLKQLLLGQVRIRAEIKQKLDSHEIKLGNA